MRPHVPGRDGAERAAGGDGGAQLAQLVRPHRLLGRLPDQAALERRKEHSAVVAVAVATHPPPSGVRLAHFGDLGLERLRATRVRATAASSRPLAPTSLLPARYSSPSVSSFSTFPMFGARTAGIAPGTPNEGNMPSHNFVRTSSQLPANFCSRPGSGPEADPKPPRRRCAGFSRPQARGRVHAAKAWTGAQAAASMTT